MKRSRFFAVLELVLGILFLLLGAFTFLRPHGALTTFVYIYGVVSIFGGIAGIVFYFTVERRTGFAPVSSLISGVLNILLGLLLVTNAWAGRMALSFLFPFWFMLLCVSRLCSLGFIRRYAGRGQFWLTLVVNVLGLVLGFLLLVNPVASLAALAYLIGFYLVLAGLEMLAFALGHLRNRDRFL